MTEFKLIKIIVIGDSGVGKTSLLNQFCYNKFDKKLNPTIGCDFVSKSYSISEKEQVKLQLWDIAGQESFQAISKLFIRGAYGCLIVTDISNEESFNSSLRWKELVDENCDNYDGKPIPAILIQNKIDLLNNNYNYNYIDKKKVKDFAKENGFFTAIQVSAKENVNIDKTFDKLMREINKRKLIDYEIYSNFGEDSKHSRSKSSLLMLAKEIQKKKTEKDCYC